MSHPQQVEFCKKIKALFPSFFQYQLVLDIGSLDINGNNRYLFDNCTYLGVDIADGNNVDIVTTGGKLQLPDESIDTIISTECLEHDMFYPETLKNMYRMLKPGGLLLFTCATDGRAEHGTERTSPECAPLLQKNTEWKNYYKNLNEKDIRELFDIEALFKSATFEVNDDSHDLYFYGFKTGEYVQRENVYYSQNKIEELNLIISEKDAVISEKDAVISEKDAALESIIEIVKSRIIAAENRRGLSQLLFKVKRKKQYKDDIKTSRNSDLFNVDWYLSKYPDVKDAKVDPVTHYVEWGARECRDPGPMFSTSNYFIAHPEIIKTGINPLVDHVYFIKRRKPR